METTEMLELSQEFAELGKELHGDGDNNAALMRVVELAVKHIDGCSWASITRVRGQQGHTLASSDDVATKVDGLQFELDEGPALQAAREDVNCLAFDLTDDPRWPAFARAVAAISPARSMLALQLLAGQSAALNLYAETVDAFSNDAIDTATIFAAHASSFVALLEAEDQASNLVAALESNREIGVALGVLMAHRKVTQEQAFTLLRVASQNLHRKLREIANEVVETGALPDIPAREVGAGGLSGKEPS
jgi:AmiR/NasT family two-component response regulator